MTPENQTPPPPKETPWWLPYAFLAAHYAVSAALALIGTLSVPDFMLLGGSVLTAAFGVQIATGPQRAARRTEQMNVQAEDVHLTDEPKGGRRG